MIFLEDGLLGTFLSIFTAFFHIDIFNSSVERVSNINTFFKIKGNVTQPISKTQLTLMNLTPEPKLLVIVLRFLWYFYLYIYSYLLHPAILESGQNRVNGAVLKWVLLSQGKEHFCLFSPKQDNIAVLYLAYLSFFLCHLSSVYYLPLWCIQANDS